VGQAEVPQDALNHTALLNQGDELDAPATPRTGQDAESERPPHCEAQAVVMLLL
jgi:hypothetical protein